MSKTLIFTATYNEKEKCKKTYLTISFMSFTKDYMCGEVSTQKVN